MRLKDPINHDRNYNKSQDRNKQRRDNCWKFNVGKCTYGLSCKYEHRCALCLKFGHGAHNCRKVKGGGSNNNTEREIGERWNDNRRRSHDYYNKDRYHYSKKEKEDKDK